MRILVVGGAGYIGSHTARELLDRGHQVAVLDDLSTGLKKNLFPEASFYEGSILDEGFLARSMGDFAPEAVVHLAAKKAAGESMQDPEKYSTSNLSGTISLLNACTRAQVKYFVFSSSAATYGSPQYLPMDEKHPTVPENYYGYTKLVIEQLLDWYDRLKGLRFAALRYFNAAGYDAARRITGLEQNPANLLPVVLEVAARMRPSMQVFGNDYPTADGTGVRDYIHVSDLAVAHGKALDRLVSEQPSFVVNLGVSRGYSVLEVVQMAARVTGRSIPHEIVGRRAGDPAEVVADARLAKTLLDWEARCSTLQSLVETTWAAYLANGVVRGD